MPMPLGPHLDRLMEAIAIEAEGQRALLSGEKAVGARRMWEAARLYKASWELAPPASYGRLIGMLKAAVIAGGGESVAAGDSAGDFAGASAGAAASAEAEAGASIEPGGPGELRALALYAREQVGEPGESVAAHYALTIAALVLGEDEAAIVAAEGMQGGSPAFVRAATAIVALARGEAEAYREAVSAIVADFEGRQTHLTGVAIADTALMLERFAARRGLAGAPASALLPPS